MGEDPQEELLTSDPAEIAQLDVLPLPARDRRVWVPKIPSGAATCGFVLA